MLGRAKSRQAAIEEQAALEAAAKQGGKGRPTPRRREAEQRNRRPVVGAPRVAANATKEERKAARQAQRQAATAERARARQALMSGDERGLPARDQGPARRYARDYVDARRSPGEFFLPVSVVVLLLGFVRVGVVLQISFVLLYALLLTVTVDSLLLARRVRKRATERFGADMARGVGFYAAMRALQLRRLRLPRPQVARGQFPK